MDPQESSSNGCDRGFGEHVLAPKNHICILCAQHQPDDARVTHKLGDVFVKNGFRVTWVGPEHPIRGTFPGIAFHYFAATESSRWERLGRSRRLEHMCLGLSEISTVTNFFAVEPDSAAVAIRLARRFGARAVFDIHEVYHKEGLIDRVPRWARPLASYLVLHKLRSICRRVDLVMGPGRTRVAPYAPRTRESMIVRHCLSRKTIEEHAATPFGDTRKVVRIMHGKALYSKGTREMIRAVAMAERMLPGGPPLRLVCFDDFGIGSSQGRMAFFEAIKEEKAEHLIELNPVVPFSKMLSILSECDIGVIAYGRECGANYIPNRIFEYMAVGIPVVVPSYAVELQPIIQRYRCGLAVDTERAEAIADVIVRLISDQNAARKMGRAGRLSSLKELYMEHEVQPLIEWLRRPLDPLRRM